MTRSSHRGKKRNKSNTSGQSVSSDNATKRLKLTMAGRSTVPDTSASFEDKFMSSITTPAIKTALSSMITDSLQPLRDEISRLRSAIDAQSNELNQLRRD